MYTIPLYCTTILRRLHAAMHHAHSDAVARELYYYTTIILHSYTIKIKKLILRRLYAERHLAHSDTVAGELCYFTTVYSTLFNIYMYKFYMPSPARGAASCALRRRRRRAPR